MLCEWRCAECSAKKKKKKKKKGCELCHLYTEGGGEREGATVHITDPIRAVNKTTYAKCFDLCTLLSCSSVSKAIFVDKNWFATILAARNALQLYVCS